MSFRENRIPNKIRFIVRPSKHEKPAVQPVPRGRRYKLWVAVVAGGRGKLLCTLCELITAHFLLYTSKLLYVQRISMAQENEEATHHPLTDDGGGHGVFDCPDGSMRLFFIRADGDHQTPIIVPEICSPRLLRWGRIFILILGFNLLIHTRDLDM